jgi:hypothetical protein
MEVIAYLQNTLSTLTDGVVTLLLEPIPAAATAAAAAATTTTLVIVSLLHNTYKIDLIQNLVEAVLLVKINVLETSVNELKETTQVLEKAVCVLEEDHQMLADDHRELKEDFEKQLDTFQAWTGTFDYLLHGYYKVRGFVEIMNTEVFTVRENREWLASTANLTRDQYVKKLAEMEKFAPKTWIVRTKDTCFLDWNGWNGTVTCRVKIYEGRDNFSRVEEALVKAPAISWERHLITQPAAVTK